MKRRQRRGRPVDPVPQVEQLEGDAETKRRLELILASLTGVRTIEDVCAELQISPSRYFELKVAMLQSALKGLAPGTPGRPRTSEPGVTHEQELEARIRQLEEELQCSMVRTEIALVMPHLLRRPSEKKETRVRPARRGPWPPLAPPRGAGDDDAGTGA